MNRHSTTNGNNFFFFRSKKTWRMKRSQNWMASNQNPRPWGRKPLRPTPIAKRTSKRPVKFTIRPSWFKVLNLWSRPVCAVQIARKNINIPPKTCHGIYEAFADISAPGNTYEKNPNTHCNTHHKAFGQFPTQSQFKLSSTNNFTWDPLIDIYGPPYIGFRRELPKIHKLLHLQKLP